MKNLSDAEKWKILVESGASDRQAVQKLGGAYMVNVIEQLPSDAAAELMRSLPKDFQEKILLDLNLQKAKEVREILSYPLKTAGALMAKEFLLIPLDANIKEATAYLQSIPQERKGKVPYIYVLDKEGKPHGVIQVRDLIFYSPQTPVKEVMKSPATTVSAKTPQSEIIKLFEKQRLLALPVLDEAGKLTGVIRIDNALDAAQKQAANQIAKMVGTDAEEIKTKSVLRILKLRLPWLFVSIVSGLTCAFITEFFQHSIATVATLFLFIPVILGLSESTAVQGATIVVRNLTLGNLTTKDIGGIFIREIAVGVFIGMICSVIVGIVAYIWQGNYLVGMALAASMAVTISISALIGLILPLVFRTLKIDPATASGPLVLAICDLQTLFVYFSLSAMILKG